MLEPHSTVHSNAHHVLTVLGQDWKNDEALQNDLLAWYEKIELASDSVMETIDLMVEEKQASEKF